MAKSCCSRRWLIRGAAFGVPGIGRNQQALVCERKLERLFAVRYFNTHAIVTVLVGHSRFSRIRLGRERNFRFAGARERRAILDQRDRLPFEDSLDRGLVQVLVAAGRLDLGSIDISISTDAGTQANMAKDTVNSVLRIMESHSRWRND